jgi:hypothetical protein
VGGIGTVYVTAAVGGQPQSNSDVVHPAHLLKINGTLGSLVIDVNGDRLDFQFINTDGVALDYFTISKEPQVAPPDAPTGLAGNVIGANEIQLTWNNTPTNEMRFLLERSADGANFTPLATLGANLTSYTDTRPLAGLAGFYRIRAENNAGASDYSNMAITGAAASLRLTSLRYSGNTVTLTWYSVPGQVYDIQQTDSLSSSTWQTIRSGILAGGYTTSWEVAVRPGEPAGFYRIQITPD